jgi:hypothetical protein
MDTEDDPLPLTVPVAFYCRVALGIGENASYAAVASGDIPALRFGPKLLRVPLRAALRKLAGDDPATLEKLTADFIEKVRKIQPREDRRITEPSQQGRRRKVVAAA